MHTIDKKVTCGKICLCGQSKTVIGLKGEKGDRGATGATGATGPTGPAGSSDRILMGDTTTLDPDKKAEVHDNGTEGMHMISFSIPRGVTGLKGEKGDKGDADAIEIGATITLEPELNAQVEDIGGQGHHILNFSIPRGVTGANGKADTIRISETITLEPDLEALVQDTGSGGQHILNFGIPRGATGLTGERGPAGPTFLPSAYLVKFNLNEYPTGVEVASNTRLPFTQKELDVSNIITLNTDHTIQFNKTGIYKLDFNVNAFGEMAGQEFDEGTDIIAIGFRKVDDTVIFVGESVFFYESKRVQQIIGSGTFIVNSTENKYELINLGKRSLFLKSPAQPNTLSTSYFLVPLIAMTIVYLGERE